MTAIMALSLMALGQTEPQQMMQGQTKETSAKETKMNPAHEQLMKAIRVHEFGGPEVLRLEEVPTPRPGPGQVLVRMHAIGVNPIETYIRTGTYAYKPTLPYTPGNDGAGVVEDIGSDVNELKPGDRVYTARSVSGTYAEFALCTTEQVHPLPANISFGQGAAVGTPYATAYRGLFQRADAKSGETVLVHGASGGVGTAAVQLARARGLRVFGTAGSDEGSKLAREQGAHEVFDHHAPDHFEQIMKATGGRGVDVIVELLANVNLGKDLTILAKGGRVVVIGSRGRVEIDPRDAMQRDADIRGMVIPNTPPAEMASIHAALVAGLENGTLRPVIGKEFPLAEAAQAHRAVMEPGAFGKIVLVPESRSKK
jgi:NADPH2:quinone reductase